MFLLKEGVSIELKYNFVFYYSFSRRRVDDELITPVRSACIFIMFREIYKRGKFPFDVKKMFPIIGGLPESGM